MEQKKARIWEEDLAIPTYELGEDERLPILYKLRINQGIKGDIYPYKNRDILTLQKNDSHIYRALRLENDYIRVTILPQLGGRIYEGYDKVNDYNFVYKNQVIKPALIGMNGAWISGGIEFNWPQHHRPTTFMPVEYEIEEEADGSVTAWVGETESRNGQRCLMGVSIHPDKSYVTAKVKLYNPTPQKEAFHWWANLAVHVNDSYRLMFPPDIDYVTFHDKTHVSPFPIVKGEFAGVDFKDGVDIRYVKNLKPASSFFIFDSQYSFMAGYDDSRDLGTVHVADRFLSPGKKFFTWGRSGYGEAWQSNLTDEDGDYIEIMTGCFTDNQPDFTWIMPYETKTFEETWYSLNGIKDLKNATRGGAIGVWKEEAGIAVSFNVTEAGRVTLEVNGEPHCFDAEPCRVYTCRTAQACSVDDVKVCLTDETGRTLVAWEKLPMFFDGKEVPQPRQQPLPPEQIASTDELWVNGMHLDQYKHPVLRAEQYYLEALKRDPGDIRCNTAMGVLRYRKGDFTGAACYLEKAVRRATSRNPNPIDPECYYQLGLAYRQLGKNAEALAAFKRAAWSYAWKSAALYQSAELECIMGDLDAALADLEASLETNVHSLCALALRSAIQIRKGETAAAAETARRVLERDPLDALSAFTLCLCGKEGAAARLQQILGQKLENYLNLAAAYLSAGLYEAGIQALERSPRKTALQWFYRAWAFHQMGDEEAAAESMAQGENSPQEEVFPNRTFDFLALDYVTQNSGSSLAPYYLGCMYCGRDNDEKAAECWQLSVQRNPEFADAHRALAQMLSECLGDNEGAGTEMEKAFALSREPRIFYELYQLRKVRETRNEDLLALLEENMDLVEKRQDLMLQYIELLCWTGQVERTLTMLENGTFYPYEGGEGQVPFLHAFAHIQQGLQALNEGDNQAALHQFLLADSFPAHYHEGAKYQECRAHLHYFMALGYEKVGDLASMRRELEKAASQRDCQTESQYYKGMALKRLGDYAQAAKVFHTLKEQAVQLIGCDTLKYFLVFPAALPFEQNQKRANERAGYAALFYGQLGLGEEDAAKETAAIMRRKGISSCWIEYLSRDLTRS